MTYILIFITVVVSVVCFRNRAWFERLALKPYRIVHNREWYRTVSHLFVHGDYTHLLVNMVVLLSFGSQLERIFKAYEQMGGIWSGYLAYLLLYFGAGIIASLYDIIARRNDPRYVSIGASGAVSAVIFASIFYNPWNKLYLMGIVPLPGILFGLLYLVYCQYMGRRGEQTGDRINHRAHLYGSLFGFLFPVLMDPGSLAIFWRNLTAF